MRFQFSLAWLALLVAPLLLPAQTTLRQAADQRRLLFGSAAQAGEYGGGNLLTEVPYAATLSTQFNMLQGENAMKWSPIHPDPTRYNFTGADRLAAFAREQKMKLRGHTLLWHSGNPTWLTEQAKTATPQAMAVTLKEHIDTVVGRYKGQIFAWDVVNEAVSDAASANGMLLRDSPWNNQPGIGLSGTAYIEQAFRWAHDADPDALLFYNDYNIEGPGGKFSAVLNMVRDFVARGVPIHGVGFQMHVTNGTYPDTAGLRQNFQAIAALGLQIHITEMDVRLPVTNGVATEANLAAQAATYSRILTICLQTPACTALQTWGFTDKYSWIPGFFTGFGAALPFDASYQPKAVVPALLNAFQSVAPSLSANTIVNAASYKGGPVAPGELVTIFGANYGPATLVGAAFDTNGLVSSNLAGTRVLFDGVPAPLIYSLTGQVSAVVPYEVAGRQQTSVEYEYNGVKSAAVTLSVASTAPAIFAVDATGSGPGLILTPGYSVVTAANPAPVGSVVIVLATGAGAVVGDAKTGGIAQGIGQQAAMITATVGGFDADIAYAGPAPGLVNGVLQVNLTVPKSLSPGIYPIVLTVGGARTQDAITIAVRQ